MMARVAGAGRQARADAARNQGDLLEGLRGAATHGTASALKPRLHCAKTGSIVMPNGTTLGLVVA